MDQLFKEQLKRDYFYSRSALYKRDLTKLIISVQPDLFVTLTLSNPKTSEQTAINMLATWLKWVNRGIFGRRSKGRLEIFPFMERNKSDGIHFHLMVKIPSGSNKIELYYIFKAKWLKLKGSGHSSFSNKDTQTGEFEWYQTITSYPALVEYVNKEAKEQRMDNLVVECLNYYQ